MNGKFDPDRDMAVVWALLMVACYCVVLLAL